MAESRKLLERVLDLDKASLLEKVPFKSKSYMVQIGLAVRKMYLGGQVEMRRATVNGIEIEFTDSWAHGRVTSLRTLQKRAIRKYLLLGQTRPSRPKNPREQAYQLELERALSDRDNWQLRMTETAAIISPLNLRMPLSTDVSKRTAQREIITIMAHSHNLLTAAKKALTCLDRREAVKARAVLNAILEDISSQI